MTRRWFLRLMAVAAAQLAAGLGRDTRATQPAPLRLYTLPATLPYVVASPSWWQWGRRMTRRVWLPVVLLRHR